mmetsp:Transcript_98472/g.317486  ORF Transcript_98472/g.317486 Transcript_98472/m.317486 type:complete len:297 (+) Transcript_98472:625-1515(+)
MLRLDLVPGVEEARHAGHEVGRHDSPVALLVEAHVPQAVEDVGPPRAVAELAHEGDECGGAALASRQQAPALLQRADVANGLAQAEEGVVVAVARRRPRVGHVGREQEPQERLVPAQRLLAALGRGEVGQQHGVPVGELRAALEPAGAQRLGAALGRAELLELLQHAGHGREVHQGLQRGSARRLGGGGVQRGRAGGLLAGGGGRGRSASAAVRSCARLRALHEAEQGLGGRARAPAAVLQEVLALGLRQHALGGEALHLELGVLEEAYQLCELLIAARAPIHCLLCGHHRARKGR